ncbi:hypothetical protein [Oceaniglobus indicus]|uniref:hypothetical protein n=1 Tax=Oceaniglobus indicus TaxID=2047749 RepID=UPI000C183C4A|nr:hypothetical protein [Oceaniglobus indicus]
MGNLRDAAADTADPPRHFNIFIVAQEGRLAHEAALFAASLRESDPGFTGKLIIGEPQPGPLWPDDPRIRNADLRALLTDHFGAEIRPFESHHFGAGYPNGNKIEGLSCLPAGEPFVFFDSDTLITGPLSRLPFDFNRPSASMRREGTWPRIELYGPGYTEIWKSLHDRFGLDFASSLDLSQPDEYWQRYLYFNAGWFFHSDPAAFGARFLDYALTIRDDPPRELVCQQMFPWLDQVALPLVVHSFGGGRHTLPQGTLDGSHSCHYRMLPLLYARESDAVVDLVERIAAPNRVKKVLKDWKPLRKMVLHGQGRKVRALFDQDDLPRREQAIRNRIRKNGFWMR